MPLLPPQKMLLVMLVMLHLAPLNLVANAQLPQCAPQDNQIECAALVEIAAMGVTASGWLSGNSYCDWTGITCNTIPNTAAEVILNEALQRRELTHLILDNQGLTGQLTKNISQFKKLDRLSLENNKISGNIPNFTGNVHVKKIVLSRNQLTGTIPELSKNTKLEYLYLSDNKLDGAIPESLSALTHLEWLSLGNNGLTGPIPSLEKLSCVKQISLTNNKHTGTFPNLNFQNELQYLDIRGNKLTGIHVGICNVSTQGFFRQPVSTFFDKTNKCTIAYNPFQCEKLPACARLGCDADTCVDKTSGEVQWFDAAQYGVASYQTWDDTTSSWTKQDYLQTYPAATTTPSAASAY